MIDPNYDFKVASTKELQALLSAEDLDAKKFVLSLVNIMKREKITAHQYFILNEAIFDARKS